MRNISVWSAVAIFSCVLLSASICAVAQTDAPKAAAAQEPAAGDTPARLAREQAQLADKYRRLEDLIFKMADFEATSNPRRAALLKQAYKQSKDRLTLTQLDAIAKLLGEQKYQRAVEGQEIAHKDFFDLLQLLLSEDRSERLKTETERIQEYIKELKRLERIQRGLRGRTEAAQNPRGLAQDQEKVADRTADLAEQLESQDAPATPPPAQVPERSDPSESSGQKPDAKPSPADPSGEPRKADVPREPPPESEPSPADPRPGEEQPAKSPDGQTPEDPARSPATPPGQPTEGEPGESKKPADASPPGDSSPEGDAGDQQQPSQDRDPAKKRVREAEQKMREAQQKLEEAKRTESVEKQTEALQKLQEAIAELEEILRQLREEELERVLALLEGRFRKMLEMELKVHEGTVRLSKILPDQRGRTVDIRAGKLAFEQRRIAGEADRALTLLREEGSSIAFPEVVEQMRDDMEEVAARLDQVQVEDITQGLEEEIISTLEELIAALQKAQRDLEEGRQPPPGQPGAGDPPLVDILAELKMIRSLQLRVQTRTERYARLLDDPEDPVGQAVPDDLRRALGKLGELELRIQQMTRDIALGKNQ